MLRCSIAILLFAGSLLSEAQLINGYAQVTAISSTVLTIGSSNETAAQFLAGGDLVIMQMQDDVIGTNTANNASFGNLSAIQQAGRYCVRRIASVTRSGSVLTSVTLTAVPGITFNIGTNTSVQIITQERRGGGGNWTTTSNIAALAWNGTIGGVVALKVVGALTLQHNITADGAGFRGGAKDPWTYTSPCNTTDFIWSSIAAGTEYFATKGEGIYKLTNTNLADGRGKILNGGGGANQINAGGGGGGNFTAGGSAGLGWSCSATAGGIGGLSLGAQTNGSRVFMGGGGGGGEGNDNVSTDGGNGGGIILIEAASIRTTGSCGGRTISANGIGAASSGNDGAGGGGAGGAIVIDAGAFNVVAGCPLTIAANGGYGGAVNNASTHGGGGGGGQGAVIYTIPVPTTNVTTQTANGPGGCDNNVVPCTSSAGSGAGASNAGIIASAGTPMPIELLSFEARPDGYVVEVRWSTASETDNALFTVERSADNMEWSDQATVPGAGTSMGVMNYSEYDNAPLPRTSYYRLKQTDTNGASTWSVVVPVHFDGIVGTLNVIPNPAQDMATLLYDSDLGNGSVTLYDEVGRAVEVTVRSSEGRSELDVSALPSGVYVVVLATPTHMFKERLLVRH